MTSQQQRAELHRRIWQIANDVRGSVDGWDFKQYVLGALFYRFISENFADYIEAGDDSVNYAQFDDNSPLLDAIKDDTIKAKGYFIYPSQLFANVAKNAHNNDNLNTQLKEIFTAIEALPTATHLNMTSKAYLLILTPHPTVWATPSPIKTNA